VTTTISIIAAAIALRTLQTTASVIGTVPTRFGDRRTDAMFDKSSENVPAQAQRPLRSRLCQCIRPDGRMQGSDAVYAGSMGRHQCRVWPPGFEYTVDNVQEFRANAGGARPVSVTFKRSGARCAPPVRAGLVLSGKKTGKDRQDRTTVYSRTPRMRLAPPIPPQSLRALHQPVPMDFPLCAAASCGKTDSLTVAAQ
jgi:hypothetical protein